MPDCKVKPKHITFPRNNQVPFVALSVKCNHNIQLPLALLARALRPRASKPLIVHPGNYTDSALAERWASGAVGEAKAGESEANTAAFSLMDITEEKDERRGELQRHAGHPDFTAMLKCLLEDESHARSISSHFRPRVRDQARMKAALDGASHPLASILTPLFLHGARPLTSVSTAPLQHPTWFLMPGLRAHPWWDDLAAEPWAQNLTDQTAAIRAEFETFYSRAAASTDSNADPSLQSISSSNYGGSWNTVYLVAQGQVCPGAWQQFPITARALQPLLDSKMLMLGCNIGYAYFSILQPGAQVEPHCGPCNIKLRAHLPLIIPSGVHLTVIFSLELHNLDAISSRKYLFLTWWHRWVQRRDRGV